MNHILLGGFWFVPVPFDGIVKFQSLAQFTMDLSQLCIVLNFFYACKLHSLIMWLNFSSLSFTLAILLCVWGMWSTPSLPSVSGPLWIWVVVSDRVIFSSQIKLNWIAWIGLFWHLNCILMLNWIGWNGTVLSFKLHTYTNWSVWNGTVFVC